jgi:hypothetical protein
MLHLVSQRKATLLELLVRRAKAGERGNSVVRTAVTQSYQIGEHLPQIAAKHSKTGVKAHVRRRSRAKSRLA